MIEEQVERNLIQLDGDEVRQAMHLAWPRDIDAISRMLRGVIAQPVDAAPRMRCG